MTNSSIYCVVLLLLTGSGILTLDLLGSQGSSICILYTLLIPISMITTNRRVILFSAGLGTLLCFTGLVYSPWTFDFGTQLINRFLTLFFLWGLAILTLSHEQHKRQFRNVRQLMERWVADRAKELHQTHSKLTLETDYLQLNKDIAASANIGRSIEDVTRSTLERICLHTKWPVGHLFNVEGNEEKRLVSSQIWHFARTKPFNNLKQITESTEFEPGVGLPGRVLESGQPAWVADATLDKNFPRAQLVQDIGIRAGFAFPVLIGKEVVGVMEFFSEEAIEPQTEMLEVMAQAGIHLGRVMERQRAEDHQEKLLSILKERIKELTCLYQVSHLMGTCKSLDTIFNELEAHIKPGWQYPDITRVKIRFDNKTYGSPLFAGTPWRLSAPLVVSCESRGSLEVYYTEKRSSAYDGPFLKEERRLIDTLANLLGVAVERITAEENIQRSEEQLRNLLHRLQQIREEERTRIAREFHDELGQVLTTLKLELDLLDRKLERVDPSLRENTHRLLELVEGTLPTVKQLIMDLRPPVLDDLGLQDAIEWQAHDFGKRTGIECHVRIGVLPESLDKDCATALFRIFQETLTNVARHAQASQVYVNLDEHDGHLTLQVNDNGKGIEPCKISDSKSLGLLGMRERVSPWGGKVDIQGETAQGTTVTIRVHGRTL